MDETFIKMCRCATEIQELWEPKPGDLFYKEYCEKDKEFSREHWPHQEDHEGSFHYVTDSLDFIDGKTGRMTHHLIQNCIWYPRQEDLQEIAKTELNIPISMELFERFMNWIFSFRCVRECPEDGMDSDLICDYFYRNGGVSYMSITEAWLCFVMEKCYEKQWDTDKEVWVVIG